MREPRPSTSHASFHRDRFTWLSYLLIGYYSYLLNGLGPTLPMLRSELRGGYLISSLHASAFALGMIMTGIVGGALAQRWRRHHLVWIGVLGMAVGALTLVLGTHVGVTLVGVLTMGTLGSLIVLLLQTGLAEQHGEQRAIALTETTIFGSICGAAAPFAVSALAATPLGWRGALLLPVVALGFVSVFLLRIPIPDALDVAPSVYVRPRRMPASFWMYWVVLVVAVAIEFCIILWSVEFLAQAYVSRGAATAALGIFLGAMICGRWLCSRLVRHVSARALVFIAFALTFAGFVVHRWAGTATLSWLGLAVAGFGVAGLYPLTLSLALGLNVDTKRASAYASLASGVAILALPLVLGWIADTIGLAQAYGGVVLLPVVGVAIIFLMPSVARVAQPMHPAASEFELHAPVQYMIKSHSYRMRRMILVLWLC